MAPPADSSASTVVDHDVPLGSPFSRLQNHIQYDQYVCTQKNNVDIDVTTKGKPEAT